MQHLTILNRIRTSPYMMCAKVNALSAIIEICNDEKDATIDSWNALLEDREKLAA